MFSPEDVDSYDLKGGEGEVIQGSPYKDLFTINGCLIMSFNKHFLAVLISLGINNLFMVMISAMFSWSTLYIGELLAKLLLSLSLLG